MLCAAPASAQNLGTFRWQLQPYGSVLNLTVVQQGSIYLLDGFEFQCGNNPSLPVSGVALPQANGTVMAGLTTITPSGHGLHTRLTILPLDSINGFYSDNAGNSNQALRFNPGDTCPGGLRVDPLGPDAPASAAATVQALQDQIAALTARLAAIEGRKQ
jgi:hypothetical protein